MLSGDRSISLVKNGEARAGFFVLIFRSPTWSAGPAGELADYSQAADQVGDYF
jgi:hypothetical protein